MSGMPVSNLLTYVKATVSSTSFGSHMKPPVVPSVVVLPVVDPLVELVPVVLVLVLVPGSPVLVGALVASLSLAPLVVGPVLVDPLVPGPLELLPADGSVANVVPVISRPPSLPQAVESRAASVRIEDRMPGRLPQ